MQAAREGCEQTRDNFEWSESVNRFKDHDIFLLHMGDEWKVLEKNIIF